MRPRAGLLMLLAVATTSANAQEVRKIATITTPIRVKTVTVCGPSGLAAGLAVNGSVYIWRIPSGELVGNRPAEHGVNALACSRDAKWLAIGKKDGSVVITDILGRPAKTLAVTNMPIQDVMFSPDGSLLAVQVSGAPVQLWSPAQGMLIAVLKTDFSDSSSMDFSPDSASFATADSDTSIRIYDKKGRLKATYSDLLLEPFAIGFMPDGKHVIIGGANCILTVLDASDAHVVRQLPKQPDPAFAVVSMPNGLSLLSFHIDALALRKFTVLLWDIRTSERRELSIDAAHIVGYGITMGSTAVLFLADSDTSLTIWAISNLPL